MKATRWVGLIGVALLVAGLAGPAMAAPVGPNVEAEDVGPWLRQLVPGDLPVMIGDPVPATAGVGGGGGGGEVPLAYAEGDYRLGLWYDDTMGLYTSWYYVAAIGEHCEVWVAYDLAFPDGDARNPVEVTQDQVNYLVDEFDNNIWTADTAFFGMPDLHDGSQAVLDDMFGLPPDYFMADDDKDRVVIMVSNIGDASYWDPTYPNYVAGFYWGTYEYYFDRNIINIDAYDFANRLGPDVARPYLYDGVIAHEFQHLLHDDADPDEDLWFNEGCADFAGYICGYGHPDSHVLYAEYFAENSLVAWEDQGGYEVLSDYGHAYLFVLYLFEQLGIDFVNAAYRNPLNGMEAIDATLQAGFPTDRSFAQIYRDFSVALLIDSKTPGGGVYEFQTIDVGAMVGTFASPNPETYDMPGAPPWGTDYVWLDTTGHPNKKLVFDGDDVWGQPEWSSDGDVLWGGAGDVVDNFAIFAATGGGTLTFDTAFDIEEGWDFGFVQVSTDGGHTWTSLANEYTTMAAAEGAHPTVAGNVPGLTGTLATWTPMSFDLSAYAGQEILVAFRYVTDWVYSYAGWYVDNVMVDGVLVSDGSSIDPFQSYSELFPVETDFLVTVVRVKSTPKGAIFQVREMALDDATETGMIPIGANGWPRALMLVTFAAPQGFLKYMDYEFGYTSK